LTLETNYPWEGKVTLSVNPEVKTRFALHWRIPGWARGEATPGDLYTFENKNDAPVQILVNGHTVSYQLDKGYAVIEREWKRGDRVEVQLPMAVKRVIARTELKQDEDRVALQRGPLVYCVEGTDNGGKAWNLLLPDAVTFETTFQKDLLDGVTTIRFQSPTLQVSADGTSVATELRTVTAIPYYSWCNRGANQMQIWLPRKIKDIKINN